MDTIETRTILLTGGTGFLGAALIDRLLDRGVETIHALVRADDDAHARGRGAHITRDPRVRWVRGDAERPRLGLSAATWQSFAHTVDEIFHCAASTRFDLPLERSHRANVSATEHVLELARVAHANGQLVRLHHVSTAYAAGRTSGRIDAHVLPGDDARAFRNPYEQTKARAERMLRSQDDVPVTIYRPSIIAGDTRSGATTNWNVLYGPMRMIANGKLPALPTARTGIVDTVGIDVAADAVAHLASLPVTGHTAYLIAAGDRSFTVEQFVRACIDRTCARFGDSATRCTVIGPRRWRALAVAAHVAGRAPRRAQAVRRWGLLAERGLRAFEPYEPYTAVEGTFDNRREQRILAAVGITMPPPDRYLATIVDYALAHDFGRSQPRVTDTTTELSRQDSLH
ncbi:MAG: SDR family oxidoreductase [Acidimicrobiales bacterium]